MNLGRVYKAWGYYDVAVDYFDKSLAIGGETKNRKGEAQSLDNLGNVYLARGQYDKAVETYEKSLAISRDLKDSWRGEYSHESR